MLADVCLAAVVSSNGARWRPPVQAERAMREVVEIRRKSLFIMFVPKMALLISKVSMRSSNFMQPSSEVIALFRKRVVGEAMKSVDSSYLIEGEGIEGDASRSISSPRQVLIVRQEDLDEFCLPRGYLKENLVISGLSVEDFMPGRVIQFEGGASVQLVLHCEPCKAISERVPTLKSILERRGILGVVTQPGSIAIGARCESINGTMGPLSAIARERVCQVIACVPNGRVITYGALLVAAGLQRVYFRALPSYLKAASALGLPAHRVVTSRLSIPGCLPEAIDRLAGEVDIGQLSICLWVPRALDILTSSVLAVSSDM
jgi:MOSC domain-containing protein YiiM